jgi:hypothetical protein
LLKRESTPHRTTALRSLILFLYPREARSFSQ